MAISAAHFGLPTVPHATEETGDTIGSELEMGGDNIIAQNDGFDNSGPVGGDDLFQNEPTTEEESETGNAMSGGAAGGEGGSLISTGGGAAASPGMSCTLSNNTASFANIWLSLLMSLAGIGILVIARKTKSTLSCPIRSRNDN